MNLISDIAVLYFPFARPEYARQTFEAIKKAQPKRFYFYCDKAREGNEEEIKNNNIIRDYVKEVDWDCELKTWFRDENIGAYDSIMNAIDWFFEYEEMGIILEEDCLASLAFFDFCRQLLPKYKDDMRVWLISGNNFMEGYNPCNYDYIFTIASHYIWGWATWRTRWKKINRNGFYMPDVIKYRLNHMLFGSKKYGKFLDRIDKRRQDKDGYFRPKSWDYIFLMSSRTEGGIGIVPIKNLTSNIGVYGVNSKKAGKFHNAKVSNDSSYKISKHPPFVISDYRYTLKLEKLIYKRYNPNIIIKLFRILF